MGVKKGISATEYPNQGYIGRRVDVIFNYSGPMFHGVIIRDDNSEPFETIFKLDDGRIIRACECQCSLAEEPKK